jgi:hypothetical protein
LTSLTQGARDDLWYVDNGFSEYMTESREVFNSYCNILSQRKLVKGIGRKIVYD